MDYWQKFGYVISVFSSVCPLGIAAAPNAFNQETAFGLPKAFSIASGEENC